MKITEGIYSGKNGALHYLEAPKAGSRLVRFDCGHGIHTEKERQFAALLE